MDRQQAKPAFGWSWRIGVVAGIAVYVHATFVILILWIALSYWLATHSVSAMLEGVGFILALFGCVVLHEYGHALTARRFGVRTRSITLLPIGGVASLEKMPDDPREEILVALAGPAVNVVIGVALWVVVRLSGGADNPQELGLTSGSFLERLMVLNFVLAGFNLIPAFPMDGGRVLRAWLSLRMDPVQATRAAAGIGQALALFFGLLGLFYNPFLLFIALFVWIGAAAESGATEVRSVLAGVRVAQAMRTEFHTLSPDEPLARAVELSLSSSQKDFPVLDIRGGVLGILTYTDLLRGLKELGEQGTVGEVMETGFETVRSDEPLQSAFDRLQSCGCRVVPVLDANGALVGLLDLDNISEIFQIRSALHAHRSLGTDQRLM